MTRWAPLVLALLLCAPAVAQTASLTVESADREARVLANGVILGTVADGPFELAAGDYTLVLLDAGGAWDARRATTEIRLEEGVQRRVPMALPVRTRIESLPLHAEVVWERDGRPDEVLGQTPLIVDQPEGMTGTLVARLDGHPAARVPAPAGGGRVTLVLRPEGLAADAPLSHSLPTHRSNTRRRVLDLGLGALAVAAGAVAVHYKFKADGVDDAYRTLGSPLLGLDTARKDALHYDTLSGIALGVSSASLGVLAVRFAIR